MSDSTRSARSASRSAKSRFITSFRITTPTMSSVSSPMTGNREKPERKASDCACRSVLSRSMNTISVRGTITCRAVVPLRSNTDWIMRDSSSSISAACKAASTISRSSAWVAKGPPRIPGPGVIALPNRINSRANGPKIAAMTWASRSDTRATRIGCRCPTVRADTPTTTYQTTAMIAQASSSAQPTDQVSPLTTATARAPNAPTVASVPASSSEFTYLVESSATPNSRSARSSLSLSSSSTRARDSRENAVSAEAKVHAIATKTTKRTSNQIWSVIHRPPRPGVLRSVPPVPAAD